VKSKQNYPSKFKFLAILTGGFLVGTEIPKHCETRLERRKRSRKKVSLMAKGKYEYWLTPDGLTRLEAYARDGLTDELIAEKMGIRRETLYDWKNKFDNISNALKRGKEVVDTEVENKLYQRAMGYTYEEITQEPVKDRDTGEISMQVTKIVKKEVQPDTTAQIFWLKNRKPTEWRDKTNVELTGKDGGPVEIESPRERIERRIAVTASRGREKEDTE